LDSRSGGGRSLFCFQFWLKFWQLWEPSGSQSGRFPGRRPPRRDTDSSRTPDEEWRWDGEFGRTVGFTTQLASGSQRSGVRICQTTSGVGDHPSGDRRSVLCCLRSGWNEPETGWVAAQSQAQRRSRSLEDLSPGRPSCNGPNRRPRAPERKGLENFACGGHKKFPKHLQVARSEPLWLEQASSGEPRRREAYPPLPGADRREMTARAVGVLTEDE